MRAKALGILESRESSRVMCYIDDVIIATETVEDHLVRLRAVFVSEKSNSEVSVTQAIAHSWNPRPNIWTESSQKIAFFRILAQWVRPGSSRVREIELNSKVSSVSATTTASLWNNLQIKPSQCPVWWERQRLLCRLLKLKNSLKGVKETLLNATALALASSDGRFVLDTDAGIVGISAILHQWQEWNGRKVLRPICYGSQALNLTQMKYGASKLEMLSVVTYVRKFHSYLAPRIFVLRVDNQVLFWLKTFSMDLGMVGRRLISVD